MSGDGNHFITGSYQNYFYLYDRQNKVREKFFFLLYSNAQFDFSFQGMLCLEASKHLPKTKKAQLPKSKKKVCVFVLAPKPENDRFSRQGKGGKSDDINPDGIDFDKKVLHASWHPRENLIAM